MAVRSSMAALITKVRLLINDTTSATFADQDIQDVLDVSRVDMRYVALTPSPSYSGATISYLDYYSDFTDWEDDLVLKQYRITTVTPSTSENLAGHWIFSATTLPPVFIVGKTYDVYRSAADLLERMAAKWAISFDFTSDGQSFRRSQALPMLLDLAHRYRLQQRPSVITVQRSDIANSNHERNGLRPTEIDFF